MVLLRSSLPPSLCFALSPSLYRSVSVSTNTDARHRMREMICRRGGEGKEETKQREWEGEAEGEEAEEGGVGVAIACAPSAWGSRVLGECGHGQGHEEHVALRQLR
eukprot:1570817-Rhodomonas_salina.1